MKKKGKVVRAVSGEINHKSSPVTTMDSELEPIVGHLDGFNLSRLASSLLNNTGIFSSGMFHG
jgi:hypothetical protein